MDSFDTTYCNATITNPSANRLPYPYRLNCVFHNSLLLSLDFTSEIPAWDASKTAYEIIVYIKFRFLSSNTIYNTYNSYSAASFPTSSFVYAYSSAFSYGGYDETAGIAKATGIINLSPYPLPDLASLTFNTISFYDRKARIGESVYYYMLVRPWTPSSNPVTQMIFRAPEEF